MRKVNTPAHEVQLPLPFTPFVCRCGRAVQIDRRYNDGEIVQSDGHCAPCGRYMGYRRSGVGVWELLYDRLALVAPLQIPKKYLRLWRGGDLDDGEDG